MKMKIDELLHNVFKQCPYVKKCGYLGKKNCTQQKDKILFLWKNTVL